MFDTLRKKSLPCYGNKDVIAPNFKRLAEKTVVFDNFYAGSLPCIPARRELHTGRYNFLHRSWGPLEPFDESSFETLKKNGIYSHLVTDHSHYLEDGGATYHNRYSTWECFRGQEGDRWKPQIEDVDIPKQLDTVKSGESFRQNWVNRKYQNEESNTSMAKVFGAGLEFIDNNIDKDNWVLQIESFDPHEPFVAPKKYRDLYEDNYKGDFFDWPSYQPVTENEEAVKHMKINYAALVSMCDEYLGKVLTKMDELNMWEDTMLIINTDHGLLLTEHDWWGKNLQPFYNEISDLPFFIYNPKVKEQNVRRNALAQTIDIPATLLDFFEVEGQKHMQGKSLLDTIVNDSSVRDAGLFGMHGGHVNIVDNKHVYMRSSISPDNSPLNQYTLMPTNIRNFFKKKQLMNAQLVNNFEFAENIPMLQVPTTSFLASYRFGNCLYDNIKDRNQLNPLDNVDIELTMLEKLRCKMNESEAPIEQYERLGLYKDRNLTEDELIEQKQEYKNYFKTSLSNEFQIEDKGVHQLLALKQFIVQEKRDGFEDMAKDYLDKKGIKTIDEHVVMDLFKHFEKDFIPAKKAVIKRMIRFAYKTN
jgi:arylsulfatase A-like enzyme